AILRRHSPIAAANHRRDGQDIRMGTKTFAPGETECVLITSSRESIDATGDSVPHFCRLSPATMKRP
ncbi:MAG TPA: hypothetical protein VIJ04_20490, partial [Xanthobacteraceae bacterium]